MGNESSRDQADHQSVDAVNCDNMVDDAARVSQIQSDREARQNETVQQQTQMPQHAQHVEPPIQPHPPPPPASSSSFQLPSRTHSDVMLAYLSRGIQKQKQPEKGIGVASVQAGDAQVAASSSAQTSFINTFTLPSLSAPPSSTSQDFLLLRTQLETITSQARRKQQLEHDRIQSELILKYQQDSLRIKQQFEAQDLEIQQLHQIHQTKVDEIVQEKQRQEMMQMQQLIFPSTAVTGASRTMKSYTRKRQPNKRSKASHHIPAAVEAVVASAVPVAAVPSPAVQQSAAMPTSSAVTFPAASSALAEATAAAAAVAIPQHPRHEQPSPPEPLSVASTGVLPANPSAPLDPSVTAASTAPDADVAMTYDPPISASSSSSSDWSQQQHAFADCALPNEQTAVQPPWTPSFFDENAMRDSNVMEEQLYGQQHQHQHQQHQQSCNNASVDMLPPGLREEDGEESPVDSIENNNPFNTPASVATGISSSTNHTNHSNHAFLTCDTFYSPSGHKTLSKIYLENYRKNNALEKLENEYQSGGFCNAAVRSLLMLFLTDLDPDDQSSLLESFSRLNLSGCAHALLSCNHIEIHPHPGVPCCMMRAPPQWGGEWMREKRRKYLDEPQHFQHKETYEKLKRVFEEIHSSSSSSTSSSITPLTDEDLTLLQLDSIGFQLLAPYFSKYHFSSRPSDSASGHGAKDLSSDQPCEDDLDGVARLSLTMIGSREMEEKQKMHKRKKSDEEDDDGENEEGQSVTESPVTASSFVTASAASSPYPSPAAAASIVANRDITKYISALPHSRPHVTSATATATTPTATNCSLLSAVPPNNNNNNNTKQFEPTSHLHHIVSINRAYEALTGYTQRDIVQLHAQFDPFVIVSHVRKDHIKGMHALIGKFQLQRTEEAHMYQVRHRADGTLFYALVHMKLSLSQGLFLGCVESILPLPKDQPMPPFQEGVDLDESVLLFGYHPEN